MTKPDLASELKVLNFGPLVSGGGEFRGALILARLGFTDFRARQRRSVRVSVSIKLKNHRFSRLPSRQFKDFHPGLLGYLPKAQSS